jgi:hypothetical protein
VGASATAPAGRATTVKAAGAQKLYALGAGICAALIICSRHVGDRGGPYFLAFLGIAAFAYLLAVRELFLRPGFSRRVVIVGLALAAVWHVAFLQAPSGADDDVHRYLWDGRVQWLGYNPYVVTPANPALAGLHTPETRTLNHPDLPTPYPAGAELFFRAVTAVHESTFTLRAAFVLCDFAIALVLLDLLRRTRRSEHWVLAYAWNPLLAIEVAGSGHVDIVGVLLLVMSAAALVRGRRALAAVAFGLAISVKLLPIVLLPIFWKRLRLRDAALAATVIVVLYVPFLDHGRIPFGSLGTYVQSFRFNAPVFAALERVAPPQVLAALAVLMGFLVAIWMRIKSAEWSPDSFAWPIAASLLCAPVVYPWYLLWFLPFLRSRSTLPLVIWTASIIPTYIVWHLRSLGRPWILPGWTVVVEYGAVAIAGAIILLRQTREPASLEQCADQPG